MYTSQRRHNDSIWSPLSFTTASKRPSAEGHERRTVSPPRFDGAVSRASFRAAILLCGTVHTLLSKMAQIAKSIGFRSGLDDGRMSLSQNPGMWVFHHG